MKNVTKVILSAFLCSLAWTGTAQAITCTANSNATTSVAGGTTAQVTTTSGSNPGEADSCEATITDPVNNNNNVNPLSVGGFNDWVEIDKVDDPATVGANNILSMTGAGATSGTWTVASGTLTNVVNFMIVLKDGNAGWGGWIFGNRGNVLGGNWNMSTAFDFVNGAGQTQTHANSHISLYTRGNTPTTSGPPTGGVVPEPSTILLLGSGLAGLGLWRMKQKK